MQIQPADDNVAVAPKALNFCQGCRYASLTTGLSRKCVREFLPGTQEYPTCLSERSPSGRCANGEHFDKITWPAQPTGYGKIKDENLAEWVDERYGDGWTPDYMKRRMPAIPMSDRAYDRWSSSYGTQRIQRYDTPVVQMSTLEKALMAGCCLGTFYLVFVILHLAFP